MSLRDLFHRLLGRNGIKGRGHVPPKAPPSPPANVRVVNRFDPCAVEKYLSTRESEDALIRAARRKFEPMP